MTFFEAWQQGAALPIQQLIPIARRFTIEVATTWLRHSSPSFDDAEAKRLFDVALGKLLIAGREPEEVGSFGESPEFLIRGQKGARIVFKSYLNLNSPGGFQNFERLILTPSSGQGPKVRPAIFIPLAAGEDGHRLGSIYVGLQYTDGGGDQVRSALHRGEFAFSVSEAGAPPEPSFFEHPGDEVGHAGHPLFGFRLEPFTFQNEAELIAQAAAAFSAACDRLSSAAQSSAEGESMLAESAPNAVRLADILASRGYHYSAEQIATFYGALKTKGFVILSGLSGTGKSLIARQLAEMVGASPDEILQLPVRPDWRDGASLLGFWNPLLNAYQSTQCLEFLLRAEASYRGRGMSAARRSDHPPAAFLQDFLHDPEQEAWRQRYGVLVKRLSGKAASDMNQDDLRVLWRVRDNGVCSLGWAPAFEVSDEVLQTATDLLLDENSTPGSRVIACLQLLSEHVERRPIARVIRALATLAPGRVPALASANAVRQVLKSLGHGMDFDPVAAAAQNNGHSLDQVWALLTEESQALLRDMGEDAEDPILRSQVLWAVKVWLESISEESTLQEQPAAVVRPSRPHFLILDEMNLARVEYYFADFLSTLESGRHQYGLDAGMTKGGIPLHARSERPTVGTWDIPQEIKLPPNLYVIGTVNVDETTFAFSPKVLDRAFTVEFNTVDLEHYPPRSDGHAELSDDERQGLLLDLTNGGRFTWRDKNDIDRLAKVESQVMSALRAINRRLESGGLQYGYRVVDDILAFVGTVSSSCVSDGLPRTGDGDTALDASLVMKLLPKMNGPLHQLEEPLMDIRTWAEEQGHGRFTRLVRKIDVMLKRGESLGHISFS